MGAYTESCTLPVLWSKRGSNPQSPACKAGAFPLSYCPSRGSVPRSIFASRASRRRVYRACSPHSPPSSSATPRHRVYRPRSVRRASPPLSGALFMSVHVEVGYLMGRMSIGHLPSYDVQPVVLREQRPQTARRAWCASPPRSDQWPECGRLPRWTRPTNWWTACSA